MREQSGCAVVKRHAGFVAGSFDAKYQQEEWVEQAGAWQNRRKSLLYWAFCHFWLESKERATQLQTLNPTQKWIGWA